MFQHDLGQQPGPVRNCRSIALGLAVTGLVLWCLSCDAAQKRHGIAMHGTSKYPPSFTHFDYARPDAPRGGALRLAATGSFDSLNPYIISGVPAHGHRLVFESLLARSFDEPFSLYGLVAQSIEMPIDRSWIIFNLNPAARFHDGSPVTADDILFSWKVLKTKGKPHTRTYYSRVTKAETLGVGRVKFTLGSGENWELPLILGLMPVLSKAYYSRVRFDRTSLEPPLGSGPYQIAELDPGRSITYRRDPNYWGWHLPVNSGRHNFDSIRYDYYRDANIALEAFKAGAYDLRFEPDAARWATGYDHPAVNAGRIRRVEIPHQRPVGMFALVFNTRRTEFHDPRVRQALAYGFDFEWLNRVLYHGAYRRTTSFFDNSEFAANQPISAPERALLAKYRTSLPNAVFTKVYEPPATDGSGKIRQGLRSALALFAEAGWAIRDGRLVNKATGRPMEFEILLLKPWHERLLSSYVRNLKRLGVQAKLRTVDSAQYENRTASFDFDVIVNHWGQSLSPGNEQAIYWSSEAAEDQGSRNYAGIKDPVVDALIEKVVRAHDRDSLIAATRALDRVLLWSYYVMPLFHLTVDRVAYWNRFGRPDVLPIYGTTTDLWWSSTSKSK